MIQVLQPMYLLFVKVFHFVWRYYLIVVQVNYFKPIHDATNSCFILLAQHEPYEVLVIHFVLCCAFKLPRDLVKNSINSFARESVSLIARKILLINQKVMVCVKLPKSTI